MTVLQGLACACMLLVVLARAPRVLSSPQQRSLWLATLASFVVTVLDMGNLGALLHGGPPSLHAADLAVFGFGLLSSIAATETVMSAVRAGRDRWGVRALVLLSVLTAVFLYAVSTAAVTCGAVCSRFSAPVVYWWLLAAPHLICNITCLVTCLRYRRQVGDAPLGMALLLLGAAAAYAAVFWPLAVLGVPSEARLPPVAHGALLAAALGMPLLTSAREAAAAARACWRIWPLWHDLAMACPRVTLGGPRRRLMDIVWPHGSWHLQLYRRVVEVRDAILVLHPYVSDSLRRAARAHAAAFAPSRRTAAEFAYIIKAARLAMLAQKTSDSTSPPDVRGGDTLAADITFLINVADIYSSTHLVGNPP